jgi:hypothetical protein
MTIGKQLAQFATYSVAMAATVGICLWVLLVPSHIDRLAVGHPILEGKLGDSGTAGLPLVPGVCGPLVTQMQGKLIEKGYSVGPADADGNFNDNTLTALEAFLDDNALSMQPKCDRQCWTALRLPEPGSVRGVIAVLVSSFFRSRACGRQ